MEIRQKFDGNSDQILQNYTRKEKMKKESIFPNKWKYFSHLQRSFKPKREVSLDQFKSYLNCNGFIEYREPTDYSLEKLPNFTEKKTVPEYKIVTDQTRLTNETRSLLVEEMVHAVDGTPNELVYNMMVRHAWEQSKLAEMLEIENFRFEFCRQTLHNRYNPLPKKQIVELHHYRSGVSGVGKSLERIRQTEQNLMQERKQSMDLLEEMGRIIKMGGSSKISTIERKQLIEKMEKK